MDFFESDIGHNFIRSRPLIENVKLSVSLNRYLHMIALVEQRGSALCASSLLY